MSDYRLLCWLLAASVCLASLSVVGVAAAEEPSDDDDAEEDDPPDLDGGESESSSGSEGHLPSSGGVGSPSPEQLQPNSPSQPTPPRGWARVSGYVQPQFAVRYRPEALPRDRVEIGMAAARAGLIFDGSIAKTWRFRVHFVLSGEFLEALVGVEVVDRDGDGSVDGVAQTTELLAGMALEELSVSWSPLAILELKLGQMRIPFTAQHQSPNAELMFPDRSAPNAVFLRGSDLGGLADLRLGGERFRLALGVFNGSGLSSGRSSERGPLFAARIDANPLGAFPFGEGDLERGPFRLGVGGGLLWFPSTIYDRAGYASAQARDLRVSGSLRIAVRGFFLQAELLRYQRTDSLSSRPELATGAYGQMSFLVAVPGRFGVAPIARVGWTAEDQGFDPRQTVFVEGGVALYLGKDIPAAPRLVVEYVGENRLTEQEQAHGGAIQLTLQF
ncbi:MAG TPA: hypothetical protein DIU15_00290 [Deltaproteobacteria bacterium]|nr:hypothetical protein [Deltaproteobacteria bacterium]HCP44466.1 hypothetical protein [Deltaproteobacteria bacterium]